MKVEQLLSVIIKNQIDIVVSVPSSELSRILKIISTSAVVEVILPQREDEAIAIMAGLEISNKKCLGIFQDSLFGNSTIVLSFLQKFNDINFRLWVGSRTGDYLLENPDHIDLSNISDIVQEQLNFELDSIEFTKKQVEFSATDIKKINNSLSHKNTILQWRVRN